MYMSEASKKTCCNVVLSYVSGHTCDMIRLDRRNATLETFGNPFNSFFSPSRISGRDAANSRTIVSFVFYGSDVTVIRKRRK